MGMTTYFVGQFVRVLKYGEWCDGEVLAVRWSSVLVEFTTATGRRKRAVFPIEGTFAPRLPKDPADTD
jgi:hypothetical protein